MAVDRFSYTENTSEPRISELIKESLYRNFNHPYFVVNAQFDIRQSGGELSLILKDESESISGTLADILTPKLLEEVQSIFGLANNQLETVSGETNAYIIFQQKQYIKVKISPLATSKNEEKLFLVTLELNTQGLYEALENKKSQDATITKNLPGVILKYKLHKDGRNEILYLTEGSKKLWGLTPKEAMEDPSKIWALMYPEDLEPGLNSIEDSAKNLTEWNADYRVSHPTLGLRWYRGIGNPVPAEDGAVIWNSIILDITEEKSAKLALEERDHDFKNLFENLNNLSAKGFDKNGIITFWNKASVLLYGFETHEILGKSIFDTIIPQNQEQLIRDAMQNLLTTKVLGTAEELDFKNNKGKSVPVFSNLTLIEKSNGDPEFFLFDIDLEPQKAAKNALKQSEAELKKILNSSLDMICTIDDKGEFVKVNQASKEILGYEPSELEGQKFMDFVFEEDYPKTEEAAALIMNGTSVTNFGNRYIRKDGSLVPIIWSARWEKEAGVMFCIAKDATEIRQAEAKAKSQEALVIEAQKLAKMGSWSFDFITQELTWTDALYEVYGEEKQHSQESRNLNYFAPLVAPEDAEVYRITGEKAKETGEPFHLEYSINTKSGERKILEEYGYSEKDDQGNVIRIYGTVQDITERKNTEVKIRESNQRFKLATQATSDVIWDWNIISGEVVWGENYDAVFGKIDDHSFFSDIQKVIAKLHPEEKEKILLSANKVLKSDQINWELEHRWLKSGGTYAYVSNKALVVRDKNQRAIRVIGAIQDISLKKQEEQQLKLMESVITNTLDAVLITEAEPISRPGPRIIFANEAFYKMTGYAENEIIGKSPRMFQGELTDKNVLAQIRASLNNFRPCDVTLINYKKNGNPFWVNLSISPVADKDGNYTHFIAIERDVTKQKNQEIQKALLNEISQIFMQEEKLLNGLESILVHLAGYAGFELAEAWILSPDKTKINLLSHYTAYEEMTIFHNGKTGLNSCIMGEGLPGMVWKSRQIELWQNLPYKKEFIRKEAALKSGIHIAFGVPLLHNEEIVGVLIFGSTAKVEEVVNYKDLFVNFQTYLGGELKRKLLEEELNQLFITAPDLICVAGLDGYFKKINPAACRLLEYSEEELLSRPFSEFLHPEDLTITDNELETLSLGIKTQYFENRYLTKSGKTIWLGWSSTTSPEEGLVYAVAKDITNQKNLQNMLDTASNLAQIGAWEVDLTTNTHYWSSVTRDIHEVTQEYVPNFEDAVKFYRKDYYDFVLKTVERSISEGTNFDFEVPIITAKGNEKWVRAIGNVEFRRGKPVKLFGSFQDITPRKTYENSLRNLNLELKKQTRDLSISNSELEQFAYVASHDLQEPLRMVTSFLTQLERKYTDILDDKGKQYIQFAVDGARRMRSIILDLLDFSRVGKHHDELQEIDLNDIIEETKILYSKAIAESKAKISLHNLPKVKGYKTPFYQLFQNLIGNALKYKKDGVQPEIFIDCEISDKEWTISIQDNGIGIEEDFYEKIFIIFQRLHHKNQYSGTGMGLAIVKKIVENMGGKIWVESRINEGSTFYFTIPKKI